MSGDLPPSYTDAQASPPRYSLPETFTIGHRNVDLLIQPQQLRGHLSMLHAFHNLRVTVESDDVSRFPTDVRAMEPEKRWGWFVNIAVERFVLNITSFKRRMILSFSRGLIAGAAASAIGAL